MAQTKKKNFADGANVPPHSIEAEQAVLGGLMLSTEAWDRVADRIVEEDFYTHQHRLIFRAIAVLQDQNKPSDMITVGETFEAEGKLEEIGSVAYLTELASNTPSVANIAAYADIVREKSILRRLIDVGHTIAHDGYQPEGRNSSELLEGAEKAVFEIREAGAKRGGDFVSIREGVRQAFANLEYLYELEGGVTGVASGFRDFDEKTAGLQRGDLVIVAGRPSMGKTSFAMNLAENAAIKCKTSVAVFSMEMSAVQLVTRMISSLGRVNQHRLRTGDLLDEDWPRITSAMNLLTETKIFIDETPGLSPLELRTRARRLKRDHDLGMIVVDYLQLMSVPGNTENRATEISEISRSLKSLARELNVPVIALSQLNRSLEQRPNKRPIMSDLRESGSIEQDADVIAFIYRDEVYNPESPDKGKAEIIIGKQRNGSTGTVPLTFQGQYTRFDNFTSDVFISGDAE
ncbi:MAG: replicative DNA helicase [Lysobacteraceae bacterium]|nr:MAG: replicative DNA helicase [Xanthomonadaceae bacterium]